MKNKFLLSADRIFDGSEEVEADGFVAIEDGRVVDTGRRADLPGRYGDFERLDYRGCTILPGIIDTHVHLSFSASAAPFHQLQSDSDQDLLVRGVANARAALLAGVTTIRDLGSRGNVMFALRDAIAKGIVPGPKVLVSGRPITCPNGHLHFLGGVASGVDGVRKLAEDLVAQGADVIKVIATGGNMTEGSDPLRPQFSLEELLAIVEVANGANIPVTAHARGVEGMRLCVLSGMASIEHARMEVRPGEWGFDHQLARDMADRGVAGAPTLAASYRSLQFKAAGIQVGVRAGAVPIADRLKNAAGLRDAGVRVVVGTDAGAALARFEEASHVEMELLVEAGWTPVQAMAAATSEAAKVIWNDQVGRIEPGKRADIMVVDGDPTKDISQIRQVRAVFKAGIKVVSNGTIVDDERPTPWPEGEIKERLSLMRALAEAQSS